MNWKNKNTGVTALIFMALFVVYYFSVTRAYPEMSVRGQFGDMFGGLNALFSGLAFLGVIYAILLQREELSLQRKELELTRKELERAAIAQENSGKALSKQAASLKVTAKLNGLSAQLSYYSSLIQAISSGRIGRDGIARDFQAKAESIVSEIKTIIEDK